MNIIPLIIPVNNIWLKSRTASFRIRYIKIKINNHICIVNLTVNLISNINNKKIMTS